MLLWFGRWAQAGKRWTLCTKACLVDMYTPVYAGILGSVCRNHGGWTESIWWFLLTQQASTSGNPQGTLTSPLLAEALHGGDLGF